MQGRPLGASLDVGRLAAELGPVAALLRRKNGEFGIAAAKKFRSALQSSARPGAKEAGGAMGRLLKAPLGAELGEAAGALGSHAVLLAIHPEMDIANADLQRRAQCPLTVPSPLDEGASAAQCLGCI